MNSYNNGFTLDFVYCVNCYFWRDKHNPLIINDDPTIVVLKGKLQAIAESIHDSLQPSCKERKLVISYSKVMIEDANGK